MTSAATTSEGQWCVVHTQPQLEMRAEANLRQQGFATYMPRYRRQRRHARRVDVVMRPLFPRYLFVCLHLGRDRWRAVQSTVGVSSLLLAADAPLAVPSGIIDEMRAREDEGGCVRLGLPAGIVVGSRVRLLDGVFAEASGVIERIADELRVGILLELLGRQVRVMVPAASVGAA